MAVPPAQQPVPRVIALPDAELMGSFVCWSGEATEMVTLPIEAYLREAVDLDLGSFDALVRFVRSFGEPGRPSVSPIGAGWAELPPAADAPPALVGAVEEFAAGRDRGETWSSRSFCHVAELQLHLGALRNLTAVWKLWQESDSTLVGDLPWVNAPYGPPVSPAARAWHLADGLAAALGHTRARLEIAIDGAPYDPLSGRVERASTYGALCTQLHNHVAENAEYHRCSNETCAHDFVRQRGRAAAVQPQHRTSGVMYCSRACARAQSERERRRRARGD